MELSKIFIGGQFDVRPVEPEASSHPSTECEIAEVQFTSNLTDCSTGTQGPAGGQSGSQSDSELATILYRKLKFSQSQLDAQEQQSRHALNNVNFPQYRIKYDSCVALHADLSNLVNDFLANERESHSVKNKIVDLSKAISSTNSQLSYTVRAQLPSVATLQMQLATMRTNRLDLEKVHNDFGHEAARIVASFESTYQKRCIIESVDVPGLPVNMRDSVKRRAYENFVKDLQSTAPDTYAKRYDDLEPDETFPHDDVVCFFAYHNGKVIGCADYSPNPAYAKGTVATVDNVVHDHFQGIRVGQQLVTARTAHLVRQGFQYQFGGVFSENVAQIVRLRKNGWRETSDSSPDDDIRFFWKALDPSLVDMEPQGI